MAWPRLLVLVRHAESEGNTRTVEERAAFDMGTHEYDLTPRGREQAQATGEYLRRTFPREEVFRRVHPFDFDVRYTSYYKRARETMALMCPGEKVYEDPRLAEAQRGIWHTMTREQIEATYPHEIVRKEREGLYHHRPMGGENWPDVELRIHSFLGTLARDYADKKVLIVVHGFWLILFQRLIHHFSIEEAERRYRAGTFENASVTVYEGRNYVGSADLVLKCENVVPWRNP